MMATKVEPEYPPSPHEESEGDGEEDEPDQKPVQVASNVAELLKRLHSTGAILKKPKKEYRCFTCDEDFPDWGTLETHLIQHVTLPSVVLDKLPSDDEDEMPSGDDWSDEDDELPQPAQHKTPQKIDISQIMKKTGISIKTPTKPQTNTNNNFSLDKLSGLGFTIKKNSTPIKEEKVEEEAPSNVMEKLGKLGGIKLKLKSDGGNNTSFKVINGLRDFKTSDDEEENDEQAVNRSDDEQEKVENEDSDDQEAPDTRHSDDDMEEDVPVESQMSIQNKVVKVETVQAQPKTPIKMAPVLKGPGRPAVKQTPRRGANLPPAATQTTKETAPTQGKDISTTSSTPERRESRDSTTENVTVKQEIDTGNEPSSTVPLFEGQIKTERASPPPSDSNNQTQTPVIANVKTETDATATSAEYKPMFESKQINSAPTIPLLSVTKKEETGVTVIEINGDSDGDDDCCVVSATPAPDIKPVVPKTEVITASYPSFSVAQSPVLSSRLSAAPSTEKQHSFNWNAPDSKPPIDMLEKSTDDIFDSLFSGKRESSASISDPEYISLDTLGPQHCCEVCNKRFTSLPLLDDHKRMTGHSSCLVMPSSSNTILPYSSSSSILSNLLPVKQLAEQVGKLSGINSGPGFTHQQNVMINIQAYPGAGGVMGPPPPPYSTYGGQGMHSGYQQTPNMYNIPGQGMHGQGMQGQGMPGQGMSGQYPGQDYMNQGYGQQFGQHQQQNFTGGMPTYSTASPMQGMQQTVYGQAGQMGPPGLSPSQQYVPSSSPGGTMKPPTSNSAIRIQNVQTFQPGQLVGASVQGGTTGDMSSGQMISGLQGQTISNQMGSGQQVSGPGQFTAPGQSMGGQMPPPGPIRMAAGANMSGPRPRMPGVRGVRPSIRPGIQVHGQVRGARPRMPIKRPAGALGGPSPQGQKRRPDMLLPGKHDNEDCQVMAMQKQRQGMPMIESVQGAKDKLNLGSQISITKKTVNKEANAMANVLASRGISIKQKQKSRSPSPERPIPHIPNLGAGVSIKHTSKSSNFLIPEAKVGNGMNACKICKKMFANQTSLSAHMVNAHPHSKMNLFKCEECPASYPKSLQLHHHKRVFHNVSGPNRELGLPVVDLSQEDTIKRLSSLGIYSFIPLANREQANGCFGIPVMSVHNMQNGMTSGLQALGADGLLSLGPLKPLPNT